MDIRFQSGSPADWRADMLVVFTFKGEDVAEQLAEVVEAAPWVAIAPALRDFKGTKDETVVLYGPPKFNIARVMLVGLGARDGFRLDLLRGAAAGAMRRCRDMGVETCAMDAASLSRLPGDAARSVEEAVCGALLGLYRYDRFKTRNDEPKTDPRWLGLLFATKHVDDALHAAARRGEAGAAGVVFTRDLVNGPANLVTPSHMAEAADALARKYALRCTVFTREQLAAMGMGAFESVFRGAEEDARMIVLEHAPKGTEDEAPIVVVGKGVTFDTGGISLKPAAKMHEMKCDMAGAGAVLGLFEALGKSDIQRRVIGIMPCTENMPDGRATRPGDVVTTLSGKTVEILNTDAEGRLLLCDALTYAQREWKPAAIIDLATLTGACVVALGMDVAAIFSEDPVLTERIRGLGETVGDRFWPLPLWDSFAENLKSDVADLANVGPREGGAINAAVFLKQFVEPEVRWAHLDIAGPAFTAKKNGVCPGGATGFAVRTLLELVREGLPR